MLKRIFVLCLVIAGMQYFSNLTLLFAQNKFFSLQCDTIIESEQMGRTQGKFYIKDNKVRMETGVSAQAGMEMVTLYDGEKAYIYFPAQNMAMVTPVSNVEQQMPVPTDSSEFNKRIIGQETVDGRICDIYEFIGRKADIYKVWIAKDINFPVKSEAAGMKTQYKNIRINVALDDSIFKLPKGAQVQDMGALMGQAGCSR